MTEENYDADGDSHRSFLQCFVRVVGEEWIEVGVFCGENHVEGRMWKIVVSSTKRWKIDVFVRFSG